jgi:hypothetical protein
MAAMTNGTTADIVRRLVALERSMERTPIPEIGVIRSTLNVSNPPTAAEITAAYGSPSEFYDVIIINDNGAGTLYWLVVSDGTSWLYEQMTKAV